MTSTSYRNAQIAVAATCAIATACFAGAVTERALFGFVFPGLLLAAGATALFSSLFDVRTALLMSVGLAMAWAEVANEVTGNGNGPAARSSFAAAALTALALAAATTRLAAFFLLPVGGIVAVAVLYGSGGEVPLTAALTCGAAVLALATVESANRRWSRTSESARHRNWSVVVVACAAVAASSVAVVTQVHNDPRRPHAAVGDIDNADVHPFWGDPFARHAKSKHHHHRSAPPPVATTDHQQHHGSSTSWWWLVALGVLLVGALAIGARALQVRRAWARTRRRLGAAPPDGVIGAWVWATMRFRAYRIPLPPQLSPDRVYRGDAIHAVPPHTAEPLRELGLLVAPIAFGSHDAVADTETVDAAWELAMTACAAAESSLNRVDRLRFRFVLPPTVGLNPGN